MPETKHVNKRIIFWLAGCVCLLAMPYMVHGGGDAASEGKILERTAARLRDENERLKGTLEELRIEISALRAGKGAADRQLKSSVSALREATRANRELRESVRELQKEIDEIRESRDETEDRAASLAEEVSALDESRARLEEAARASEEEKGKLKAELLELRKTSEVVPEAKPTEREIMKTTHYNLGVLYQEQERWNDAIREYNRVLRIAPDDAYTHHNLGMVYENGKRNRAKAIYHYQRYMHAKPDADDIRLIRRIVNRLTIEERVYGEPGKMNIEERTSRF